MIATAKLILTGKETYDSEYSTISKHDALEAMIEFAKIHVKEALKTALDESSYGSSTDTVSYEDCVHILDCYLLKNIK